MNRREREITPTKDASIIGVSDRDRARDVETFFASHPFGAEAEKELLEKLAADAFFRRFLDAPASGRGLR